MTAQESRQDMTAHEDALLQDAILRIALSAAVPLRIAELAGRGADGRAMYAAELTCGQKLIDGPCPCKGPADIIATHFDGIARGDGGHGAASAFNAAARGLAVLAYAPGGVYFAGMHWEASDQ